MSARQPDSEARSSDLPKPSARDLVPSNRLILSFLSTIPIKGSKANLQSEGEDVLALVRRGLPVEALQNLVQAIGAPQKEVAGAVGISATTLGRRRKTGRLTLTESDHVIRIARLFAMTRDMMVDDTEAAKRWLTTPQALLGDETPLRRAATETGGREVEQLIGQLRHGVFS